LIWRKARTGSISIGLRERKGDHLFVNNGVAAGVFPMRPLKSDRGDPLSPLDAQKCGASMEDADCRTIPAAARLQRT